MMFHVAAFISLFFMCITFICHAFEDTTPCGMIRNEFAEAISEFSSCSIYNSHPITFCLNCINQYIHVLHTYRNMSEVSDNGTTCLDHFVNLDRLQIIKTQNDNSRNLWQRGKCNECHVDQNGIPIPTISNKTKTFLKYYGIYKNCTTKYTDDKNLCHNCMDHYVTLHDYYLSISNSNEKISLCTDLVDLMNTTWTYWSENCCIYRRHNEYIFIGSTASVILLTILFYLIVKFSSEKRVPTIIQQTRFAESVSSLRN